jgi:pterin-4a-carbinolamine dehydratase
MNAKKELIQYGYLEKVKQNHKENGDFGGCDYIIYKEPLAMSEIASTLKSTSKIASTLKQATNNKDIETNTDLNNKDNKKEIPLQKIEDITEAIPTCIDSNTWQEWKNYRHKEKKQKLTISTIQKQLKQLQQWHSEGHDPNEIINCSIMNGWSGLFAPKTQHSNQPNQTKQSPHTQQEHPDEKIEKLITEIKSQLLEYPDDFYNRSGQCKRTAKDWKIIENNSKIHEKYNIKNYSFVLDYTIPKLFDIYESRYLSKNSCCL